ncbi:YncE family protein [Paenibacillus sp. FSL H8-0122]|uniref:YncE family protein n=1 Tax=Paenibacillus sp. FSL H8-0122 TaxID=2954510 RepID=UPI0030FC3EC6
MNPNMEKANNIHNFPVGDSYVYVSYELDYFIGYVAVIDPVEDKVIKRIQVGMNPGPMCMNPVENKLYVVNTHGNTITVIDVNTFNVLKTVRVGTLIGANVEPVEIFFAPNGYKVYVANSVDHSITIIDAHTDTVITNVDAGPGTPFAFASNQNSSYVYVACKLADKKDYIVAISVNDNSSFQYGNEYELTFDGIHNPLTVHPDGHTQVTLGTTGLLSYLDIFALSVPTTFSLLDNTVSAVYLDNEYLFCTTQEGRSYLKQFIDLEVNMEGQIQGDYTFSEIPSHKGQDKIRVSRNQKYIGVTIQPTTFPTGGLQILNPTGSQSWFVALDSIGDLAFYSDTKAYVGELSAIRPIDLATATALPAIPIGFATDTRINVKNIISG